MLNILKSPFVRWFLLIGLIGVICMTIITQFSVHNSDSFKIVQGDVPSILVQVGKLRKDSHYSVFYMNGTETSNHSFLYSVLITNYRQFLFQTVTGGYKDGKWNVSFIYNEGENGRLDQVYPITIRDSLAK
jgi:hypothetical protein